MQASRPKFQSYKDFPIYVSRRNEVRIGSIEGEATGMLRLSLREYEVERALDSVSQATRGYATRGIESNQWDPIRDLGMQLFSALFEGARMTAFQSSQVRSSKEGDSLRLRLHLEDPNLTALPWEFMHDGNNFLSLSPRFSIVRTTMPLQPPRFLRIQPPLEVLLVTSSPNSYMGAMLEREVAELNKLKENTPLSLKEMRNPTPAEVKNALAAQPIHVFHYFDEAAMTRYDDNALLFMNEKRRPVRVGADQLSDWFRQTPDLRLVYLSTQRSAGLAEELAKDVPAVMGIRGETSDEAIFAFTEVLYHGMLAGSPLEEAVMQARQEIDRQRPGSREWGLPVFYLQTPDSIFLTGLGDLDSTASQPIQTINTGVAVTGAEVNNLGGVAPEEVREWKKLKAWISVQQKNLEELKKQQAALGSSASPQVLSEIELTSKELENSTMRLNQITEKSKL